MLSIVSLLVVVAVSIIVTRIATIALVHTGLAREVAAFQARSAFTGVGFTTSETERMVNHPVRRRIILLLMLLGNAGIVTAVSTLVLGFVAPGSSGSPVLKIVLLVAGVVALWAFAQSQWVDVRLSRLIDWALARYTRLEVRDYASVLRLAGEYRIAELQIEPGDWLADRTLAAAGIRDEGVVVLGITRADGTYIGAPTADTHLRAEDTLLVYGRVGALGALDERRADRGAGREHAAAVAEQRRIEADERRHDPAG